MNDEVARVLVELHQAVRSRSDDRPTIFPTVLGLADLAILLAVELNRPAGLTRALFEVFADSVSREHDCREAQVRSLVHMIFCQARCAIQVSLGIPLEIAKERDALGVRQSMGAFEAAGEFVDLLFLHGDYLSTSTSGL
ncbi:hypothetical protein DAI43_26195 [Achromobacter xylosoxidans]|nr:hypothetical protein DAI43_26195 [Achromobacter xylosoxidans]